MKPEWHQKITNRVRPEHNEREGKVFLDDVAWKLLPPPPYLSLEEYKRMHSGFACFPKKLSLWQRLYWRLRRLFK